MEQTPGWGVFIGTPGPQISCDARIASQVWGRSALPVKVLLLLFCALLLCSADSWLSQASLWFCKGPPLHSCLVQFPESGNSRAPSSVSWIQAVFQHHEQCLEAPSSFFINMNWVVSQSAEWFILSIWFLTRLKYLIHFNLWRVFSFSRITLMLHVLKGYVFSARKLTYY